MQVAILHNPRPAPRADAEVGATDDAFEEYDGHETIAAIAQALTAIGVVPIPVPANGEFPWRLKQGGFDFVFNMAEGAGRRCREAVPAAICEFLGLPFTGSDALTLAATLDKAVARRIVSPEVPVARGVLVTSLADEAALATLSYPVFVKPNDEGSSIGIRRESLCSGVESAVARCGWLREHYACPILVEEFLPGAEVTVAVRGNGSSVAVLGQMEIAAAQEGGAPFLYGLEAKRDFRRQVRYHVPPRLPAERLRELGSLALTAYRLLGCRDIARLDFRLDASGQPRFLECNPLPGLNPDTSDIVILCRALADGPSHASLVQGILRDAAHRHGMGARL